MDFIYKDPLFILETAGFTIFLLSFVIFFTFLKKKYERAYNLVIFYVSISAVFILSIFSYISKLKDTDTFSWGRLRGGDLSIFLFMVLFLLFFSVFLLSLFLLTEKKNKLPKKIAILLPSISFFMAGYKNFFLRPLFNHLLMLFSLILIFIIIIKTGKNLKKYSKHLILSSLFLTISLFGLSEEVMKISKDPVSLSKKSKVTPKDCGCLNCHNEKFFRNFKIKDRGKFRVFMLTNNIDGMKNLKVPPQVIDKLSKTLIKETPQNKFFNHFFKKGCFNCHLPENDKNKISQGGGFLDFKKYPEEKIKEFLIKKESDCMKGYNLTQDEVEMLLNYIYKEK